MLYDKIENASDSLWQLLLGILDKATLTLGDNRRVDFSKAMVIMTSNLGAREMSELISGGIGFAPGKGRNHRTILKWTRRFIVRQSRLRVKFERTDTTTLSIRFINSGENFRVYPLSNLVATGQIGLAELVHVDVDGFRNRLDFSKSLR